MKTVLIAALLFLAPPVLARGEECLQGPFDPGEYLVTIGQDGRACVNGAAPSQAYPWGALAFWLVRRNQEMPVPDPGDLSGKWE